MAARHKGTARVAAATAAPGVASTHRQVPATPALVMAIGLVRAVHPCPVAAQAPLEEGPVGPEDKPAAAPAQEWVAGRRALALQELLGRGRGPVLVPERPGLGHFRVAVLTLLIVRLRASRRTVPGPAAPVVGQAGVAGLDGPVASAVALVGAAAPAATGARGAGSGAGKN